MFTGIITDIGTVLELHRVGDLRARIGTSYDVGGIDIGGAASAAPLAPARESVATSRASERRIGDGVRVIGAFVGQTARWHG
jgi:hypothetical protein